MGSLDTRTVLIAGATSTSGHAATRALVAAGARVIATGRDATKLTALAELGAHTDAVDLTDEAAVADLATRVHAAHGRVDGILHLVGGWRGGGGLAGQTDADFRFLEGSLTALRLVSRAFDDDLRASDAAREAMVSSTAVARPLAGDANYVAVKAASEAWMRAVAQGFAQNARTPREARESGATPEMRLRAASVVFRVKALEGLEDMLAEAYIDLWAQDAAAVNDTVITLAAAE